MRSMVEGVRHRGAEGSFYWVRRSSRQAPLRRQRVPLHRLRRSPRCAGEESGGTVVLAPDRYPIPRASAAEERNPRTVANSSGSSRRKASWPRSVSISTKETLAPAALSARTTALLSGVGKSQSEVKETTQKRVLVPRKALARRPPCSAARSK